MSILLSIPVLIILFILQTVIVSHIPLLNGTADLFLLWLSAWALIGRSKSIWVWSGIAAFIVAFASANSIFVPFIAYFFVVIVAKFFKRRIWQSPIMAMFFITFSGAIVQNFSTYFLLSISGTPLPFNTSLVQVIIPSIFLNLLLALPVYALAKDLYIRLFPEEVEE